MGRTNCSTPVPATAKSDGSRVLSYSVLRQLARPNRFAVLEIWDSQASYNTWQGLPTTTNLVAKIKPLLGSPFDHRLTVLCGKTYVDGTRCTPPQPRASAELKGWR